MATAALSGEHSVAIAAALVGLSVGLFFRCLCTRCVGPRSGRNWADLELDEADRASRSTSSRSGTMEANVKRKGKRNELAAIDPDFEL